MRASSDGGILKGVAVDNAADLLDDEGAVHQEQRLLRHDRFVALAGR